MQPSVIPGSQLRASLAIAAAAHVIALGVAWWLYDPRTARDTEVVDIELAPAPPPVEALPEEEASPEAAPAPEPEPEPEPATVASTAPPPEEPAVPVVVDAGVDAPPDAAPPDAAPPDAPPDAAPPDAPPDAAPLVAATDAGADAATVAIGDAGAGDAPQVAIGDAGPGDAPQVATADDAGVPDAPQLATIDPTGPGSGGDPAAGGSASGSGSGATTEPAVDGAPTTAGTAANLLAYFPAGHTVTALIRFDRLRGTEWAAKTDRLLQPMPDYRVLFGGRDARVHDKLETLIISTPRPRDATATTLVARTRLGRAALRQLLGKVNPVKWSAARGGLLGKRGGHLIARDHRVFLSPFRGWFVLAQPRDLPGLAAPARGALDAVEATGRLPAWLANIRKIEAESGVDRGPALVVTLAMDGKRVVLGAMDFGLGVKSFPRPLRLSLALELVKQGWLVRGNIRFASAQAAAEFVAAAQTAQQRIGDSRVLQLALGGPSARVVANLGFARTGPRVSYTTSISIADARALMAFAAHQLDAYYRAQSP